MPIYLSTFIPGLQKPVEKLLRENLGDVKIKLLLDGLVLYQTKEDFKTIQKLKFINNSFLVLRTFEKLPKGKNALNYMFQQAINSIIPLEALKILSKVKSFRVIVSNENKFVSIESTLLNLIEDKIINLSHTNLKPTAHRPQLEVWFLRRRENIGFFMLKLTKNIQDHKLLAGELRSDLAYILNYLSEPQEDDIFLDPFAGYGSIPIERAKNFPYDLLFASDINKNFKQLFKNRLKTKNVKKIIISKVQNALNMQAFQKGFITKIVTDPPWGLYKNINDITGFYSSMLNELIRVLKVGGIMIILTAQKNEFEDVVSKHSDLILLEKYEILVLGKKAGIYKLRKI